MEEKKDSSMMRTLMTAGAFISYTAGAGCASGNEVLQFYASWGLPSSIFALISGVLGTIAFLLPTFWISSHSKENISSRAFSEIAGNVVGKILQVFSYVIICCAFFMMFSASGTIVNQELGLPKLFGSVLLGVLAILIVLGGLKRVESVLGLVGLIRLGYTLVFAVISFFYKGADAGQAQLIADGVEQGVVTQANLFALFPFSLIPSLAGMNNGLLEGAIYAFVAAISGFPFYFLLGKRAKRASETSVSAIVTSVSFYLCIAAVAVCLLLNGAAVFNPETGSMYEFPLVAVIDAIWPSGSWTYAIMIYLGILTTVVGYLYVLKDLAFSGQEEITNPMRLFYVAAVVAGIALGSRLPFSTVINIMYPYAGLGGFFLIVFLIIKVVKVR